MKKILSIIVVLMLLYSNLSFCSQENSVSETKKMDIVEFCIFINRKLKKRKQKTKKFVQQQFNKGYSPKEIKNQVRELIFNTKEMQAFKQSKETKEKLWKKLRAECRANNSLDLSNMMDTPACDEIKKNYINTKEEYKELQKAIENIPEKIIEQKLSRILAIEEEIKSHLNSKEYKEKAIEYNSKQKQKIETEIQDCSKREQEFLDSLFK